MNHAELSSRRLAVMKESAERWKTKAADVADAAARLAEGGPMAATSAARTASFVARETVKRALRPPGLGWERIVGDTVDLDDVPPTVVAKKAGRPIARIVELVGSTRVGAGFATGFLVGPGLLVTNWHVFARPDDARGCGAQLGYERNDAGLVDPGVVFGIDPDTFFLADQALDIAIVGLDRTAALGSGSLADYDTVRLIPSQGKILVGHPVSIIQHPDGRHKHWAVRQNKLVVDPADDDPFISYTTDTLPGSSGSPAFNHDWELVAIHHSGVPRVENGEIMTKVGTVWQPGMPDSSIDWVANEGARVSKVYAFLQQARLPDAAQQALVDKVLAASTDPVMGPGAVLPAPADAAAPLEGAGRGTQIVVHGTANIYIDSGRTGLPAVVPVPAPVAPGPLATAAEKKLRFDQDYDGRRGYLPTFLEGFDVPRPSAPSREVLTTGRKPLVLDYHHYSLVMHRKRRLVMWAAANADYSESKRWRTRKQLGEDTWIPDPRIPIKAQIEDLELYDPAAKFDRGHIVRRDDVAWGEDEQEEEFGNSDSFHWTNCTPQHEGFNRDAFGYKGLWGSLENHIARQAGFLQNRLILIAGPVLDAADPVRDFGSGIPVQVPIVFWKVLVAVEDADEAPRLRAYGFILDQTAAIERYGWEGRFRAGTFTEIQVSLTEITRRSRVVFDPRLHEADPLVHVPQESRARPLRTLADVVLRGVEL